MVIMNLAIETRNITINLQTNSCLLNSSGGVLLSAKHGR